MSIDYIRKCYAVPAKRGMRVRFGERPGKITGARGPYLMVLLDGETRSRPCHPTWRMSYCEGEGQSDE